MVFLCLGSRVTASMEPLAKDTIIINGVSVNVRVDETLTDEQIAEEAASDSIPKISFFKGIGFSANLGGTLNRIVVSGSEVSLDEFVDKPFVKGGYSNVNIYGFAKLGARSRLLVGVGYCSWSQSHLRMEGEVSDSLFNYYSPGGGEFYQVTRFRTFGGTEYDTLALNLMTDNFRQNYFEVTLENKWSLLKPSNSSVLEVGLGISPGVLTSTSPLAISTVLGNVLAVQPTEELEKNQFNLTLLGSISYESMISESFGAFMHFNVRRNFSNIFNDRNRLLIRRNSLSLGLGVNFYFN